MTEANELQFVDTNIFVYAYNTSDKTKHQCALSLLTKLWHTGAGCLSIQVLQELYVTLTLKVPDPLTPETCTPIIEDLGQWRLHRPELKSILEAMQIQQQYSISFWDAMIICSARELGCKQVWTEDLNTGQSYSGVTAVNPFLL